MIRIELKKAAALACGYFGARELRGLYDCAAITAAIEAAIQGARP
jgi:hypothetical protein